MDCDEDSRVTKKATTTLKFGSKTQLFTRALLYNTKLMSRKNCSLLSHPARVSSFELDSQGDNEELTRR